MTFCPGCGAALRDSYGNAIALRNGECAHCSWRPIAPAPSPAESRDPISTALREQKILDAAQSGDYAIKVNRPPVLPINPQDEALVDGFMAKRQRDEKRVKLTGDQEAICALTAHVAQLETALLECARRFDFAGDQESSAYCLDALRESKRKRTLP